MVRLVRVGWRGLEFSTLWSSGGYTGMFILGKSTELFTHISMLFIFVYYTSKMIFFFKKPSGNLLPKIKG